MNNKISTNKFDSQNREIFVGDKLVRMVANKPCVNEVVKINGIFAIKTTYDYLPLDIILETSRDVKVSE